MSANQAIRAVNSIVRDMKDYSGLKSEWDRLGNQTKEDIKAEWVAIMLLESRVPSV